MASAIGAGSVHGNRSAQQGDGPATILAIGTANPANRMSQDAYPDQYFRVTKREDLTQVKERFKTLCKNSGTERRFFYHDEAFLAAHPEFLDRAAHSLDERLEVTKVAVPELAAAAARKAIAEWGRPASDITHLVVATNSGAHTPGVDFRLVQLLGLRNNVRRTMLYVTGCFAGAAVLRMGKDLAENNRGARVLVVCAEVTITIFASPVENHFQTLVHQGFFGDGAGAIIVGSDPGPAERPLLEIMSAAQNIIPETEAALSMQLTSKGLVGSSLTSQLPVFIAKNLEPCLMNLLSSLGTDVPAVPNWDDLFWVVHPGTAGIVNQIEKEFKLQPDKMAASRRILRDYGNMYGATVLFVLEETLKHRHRAGEWGLMMAFGPGITIESLLLRFPDNRPHSISSKL